MRDYDPTLGRYLQADPLGLVDGASVYGYALQNPGRWTDPTGEFIPVPVALVIGGAVAGYLLNWLADHVEESCGCEPVWDSRILTTAAGASAADGFGAKVPKGGPRLPGASGGTSYQSRGLSNFSNRMGLRSPWRIPTPSGVQRRPFWRMTTNVGRAVGRWAPWASAAFMTYDVWRITRCVLR